MALQDSRNTNHKAFAVLGRSHKTSIDLHVIVSHWDTWSREGFRGGFTYRQVRIDLDASYAQSQGLEKLFMETLTVSNDASFEADCIECMHDMAVGFPEENTPPFFNGLVWQSSQSVKSQPADKEILTGVRIHTRPVEEAMMPLPTPEMTPPETRT